MFFCGDEGEAGEENQVEIGCRLPENAENRNVLEKFYARVDDFAYLGGGVNLDPGQKPRSLAAGAGCFRCSTASLAGRSYISIRTASSAMPRLQSM